MQSMAQGRASRRSGAIGLPQVWHSPKVPASIRFESGFDLDQVLLFALSQLLAALALGDLRRGGGLGAVGDPGMLDLFREIDAKAPALGLRAFVVPVRPAWGPWVASYAAR